MKNEQAFDKITRAITCRPGKNFIEGSPRAVGIPDYDRAFLQHEKYCEALEKCGVSVTALPANPLFPGRYFINAAAVVTEYLAVVGNARDNKDIVSLLAGSKCLKFIMPPGRLDCSDVLRAGARFYISLSGRTNHEGAAQLAFFLNEYGYQVTMVELPGGKSLRLGTAAVCLGRNRILIREELAQHPAFLDYSRIVVPQQERGAANALMVNGTLILPAGYAETLHQAKQLGLATLEVNISEFEKMGVGAGCLSLLSPKNGNNSAIELPLKLQAAA
jgi:dimethylargininase